MKRLLLGLCALATLVSCAGGPRIQFDQTSYNFGKVEPENELVHVFEFSNAGKETLIIEKVRAG